ncbi:MAG TPA: hypothetical protein VKR56_00370 [Candidatus Cybelea sp.]|nr:hypothetical protein [Candidatus Cybelea sp.]
MRLLDVRPALLVLTMALLTSACGGSSSVPSSSSAAARVKFLRAASRPDDNTSILKKLTKDVIIGSTVDPSNAPITVRPAGQA